MNEIAVKYSLPRSNVFLIDNTSRHIYEAACDGFSTIYVDNNHSDRTHGAVYIKKLKSTISSLYLSDVKEQEKISVILEKNIDPSSAINFPRKVLSHECSENDLLCPDAKEEICDSVPKKTALARFFNFFSSGSKKQSPFFSSGSKNRSFGRG